MFTLPQGILCVPNSHLRRDANDQFGAVNRLGNEVVGTKLDGADSVICTVQGGNHDDRQVLKADLLADSANHLKTVHSWHQNVSRTGQ